MAISTKQQVVLHPIMFALYPVAFLYTGHQALFDFSVTFGPAAISMLFAGLIWLVLTKAFSDWNRAAVATSALLMTVFSYSSLMRSVQSLTEGGQMDLWSKLIAGCIVAVIAGAFFALRSSKHLGPVNYVLNVVSIFLVASPMFQVAMGSFGTSSLDALVPDRTEFNAAALPAGTAAGPDIYYFVLDGYARNDVSQDVYGFNNSEMNEALAERGFTVAEKSVANYPYTLVSVNSSLNFTYLQDVMGDDLAIASDQGYLRDLMKNPRAVRLLKSAGYQVVTFESEYWGANIGGADVNLKEWWFLNHFNFGLLQMTPLPAVIQAAGFPFLFDQHRVRTSYPFTHMQDAVAVPGPKFVYAHTFFAHPPFVFGENGESVSSSGDYTWVLAGDDQKAKDDFVEGYKGQVKYLNQHLLSAIDQILENSEQPPIIIMHGDHGPGLGYDPESLENTDVAERFNIFYAAHLPDGGNDVIYDSMSPVNGMRVVFNKYFGTNFEMLEDHAYFASHSQPYDYTLIPSLSDDAVPATELSEGPAKSDDAAEALASATQQPPDGD